MFFVSAYYKRSYSCSYQTAGRSVDGMDHVSGCCGKVPTAVPAQVYLHISLVCQRHAEVAPRRVYVSRGNSGGPDADGGQEAAALGAFLAVAEKKVAPAGGT